MPALGAWVLLKCFPPAAAAAATSLGPVSNSQHRLPPPGRDTSIAAMRSNTVKSTTVREDLDYAGLRLRWIASRVAGPGDTSRASNNKNPAKHESNILTTEDTQELVRDHALDERPLHERRDTPEFTKAHGATNFEVCRPRRLGPSLWTRPDLYLPWCSYFMTFGLSPI